VSPEIVVCWLASLPASALAPTEDPNLEQIQAAMAGFDELAGETQGLIVAEIDERVRASQDAAIVPLRVLLDRARKELRVERRPDPAYHAPREFAPNEVARGRVRRAWAPADGERAAEMRGRFRPWENEPFYSARVLWDFGRNVAGERNGAPDLSGRLFNALNGYPQDSDVLVAWLLRRFDFDAEHDALALHFGHAYCDLDGNAYADVTIFDAWASGDGFDMPDIDVIPYARAILGDRSFVSPIPPDARREKLYVDVGEGFLRHFRYRVWIDAAANLWLNPDVPLRDVHEGLRGRLLYLFAQEDGDPERIAARLAACGTREAFIDTIDEAQRADPRFDSRPRGFVADRLAQRWVVAREAQAVLREHELLPAERP
jgi:hypothetical protein